MSPGEDGLIGIPFPEHSSELLLRLNAQRRAGLLCDLTLTSRGARYPTHRSVMAAVSLYFRRLFGAEEGEEGAGDGAGGGCSVCQLDCVAPDALDALLEFAYTATLTIRGSGMREVLKGAQLLGIQCVADACRDILGETGGKGEGERAADPPGEGGEEEGERASSRRKRDRRHVAKVPVAASPGRPAWKQPEHGARSLVSPPPSAPGHQLHPHAAGQNGAVRGGGAGGGQEPRGTALANGGVHWQQEGTLLARPKEEGLSEEEGRGEGGAAVPTSAPLPAERGGAVGAGGVRKRKSQTPQQCPVCLKIIHGAGKLPRHMRTHTGEKPFQCSACGVRFTRNDKLKIHMRKHTGERPYPCPDCTARFLHSYDLKNHLSLHSGARPFECPLCHKAFAREDHLQRHRKGHSCLELRTRRPRRGPGGGEEPVSGAAPHLLDPLAPQQHPSSSSSSSSSGAPPPPLLYHHEGPEGLPIPLQHPSSSSSSSSSGAPPPPLLYHQEGPEGLPIPLQHPSSSSSSSSSGAPPPPLLYHQEGPEGLPIPLQALPLLAPHRLPYHGLFWRGMEVLGGGAGLEEDEDEEEEEDSRSPPHAAPPPRHARWEGEEEDEEEEGEEEEEEE